MKRDDQELSRRAFLRRTAVASLGTIGTVAASSRIAAASSARSASATEPVPSTETGSAPTRPHGAELRGMGLPAKDRSAEGRFGVMFKKLPAFTPSDVLLIDLGREMEEQPT